MLSLEKQQIGLMKIMKQQMNVLDDLQYRLEHTRPFTKPLVNDQSYGFNGNLANEILDHWKTKYNWRKREKFLNKYPQFITSVQGLKIHFLHVKNQNLPQHIRVLPLLILHGWPGSVREFYEIIPLLTNPRKDRDFVFEVIVPHLPGYAFSDAASIPGLGVAQIGVILKNLMNRLGFQKFYLQGGDLGALVNHAIAANFEDSVLGLHLNMCVSIHPYSLMKLILGAFYPSWIKNEQHRNFLYPLSNFLSFIIEESGYLHLQATKPDSLDGGLKRKFKYDDLLDNIMLYWINKSATTAFRLYAETFNRRGAQLW
ncbi:hypothetical protein HHI36_007819 [Cryptolaemus montrouzieri]|uniref:microsomal epoxide hydrolase n=1 Tax=Cryptolaemus montrouzieri TaxID=559131 RepID=A0ABD2MR95_9CUCU